MTCSGWIEAHKDGANITRNRSDGFRWLCSKRVQSRVRPSRSLKQSQPILK